ncbi:related to pisatin demethylase (cytochrome P450) [Phialocephala subalpina]|uniref:Related to pisatin demethylase (Cytochrome P450) n=1 Tax=Phialocephala subalpina TaxID=576137 RepID=A0A1L7XC32_9HELO|nr:related to pisatin demethylase (cytochrome P450) [Phialocephala subalpina]
MSSPEIQMIGGECLESDHGTVAANGSNAFVRLEPGIDNIVSQRDGKLHNSLRAKMALSHSGKDNDHLEETIDQHLLGTKYLSAGTKYRPVDFSSKAQYFTLDVITDIAFGKPFGNLAADEDLHHYIELMELGGNIAQEIFAERFDHERKERRDMLRSFIRHGLTQREVDQVVVLQVVAGFDTTAGVLRATMLYIVSNPRVYSRIGSEIATTLISTPVTDSEARRMPYLQAVIKEGLRIHPPAAGLRFREVPASGDTLSGYFVPEGTWVKHNLFGLMPDPNLWGGDAKVFRPERWLNAEPEQLRKMEANLNLVFSWGKWQCLGKNVAMTELNKVFVELFRNFDFTVVDPQSLGNYNASIHITSDFWMRITKREPRM